MQNLLTKLKILQTVDNQKRTNQGLKKLGKGYFNAHRLNPYNPLSYLLLLLAFPLSLSYSLIKEIYLIFNENPFKWN